jgi:hypothetical protein
MTYQWRVLLRCVGFLGVTIALVPVECGCGGHHPQNVAQESSQTGRLSWRTGETKPSSVLLPHTRQRVRSTTKSSRGHTTEKST